MRHKTVVLKPLHQILAGVNVDGVQTWELSGAAPQFEIQGVQYPLNPGLYRLKIVAAETSEPFEEPMLFADSGTGYAQQATCWLNFTDRGSVREAVFLLRQPAMRLRFDPRLSPGTLRLGEVSLQKASRTLWRARGLAKRMQRRIRSLGDVAAHMRKAGTTLGHRGLAGFLDALDRQVYCLCANAPCSEPSIDRPARRRGERRGPGLSARAFLVSRAFGFVAGPGREASRDHLRS